MNNHSSADQILSVEEYLKRIEYTGSTECSLANLTELQETHVHTVPYENLDIVEGREVSLAPECIYDKIVTRRRGGYCFELNGLFSWLLSQLGYKPIEFFGRWLKGEELAIPPRRHRICKVIMDGQPYICDVGVGMNAPRHPLVFEEGLEQKQGNETYRIISHEKLIWVVQELEKGEWGNLYSFTEDIAQPIDFFMPHYYCTTHPESIFLNLTMVYIRTREGRNTIADVLDPVTGEKMREFRIFKGDKVESFIPRFDHQWQEGLKTYFGIEL